LGITFEIPFSFSLDLLPDLRYVIAGIFFGCIHKVDDKVPIDPVVVLTAQFENDNGNTAAAVFPLS
jgi:hypothetical protein